jgi:hypothetical protein
MELELLDRLSKNMGISNFKKIRPVGAELFYADGQTKRSERSLFAVLRTHLLSALDNNI